MAVSKDKSNSCYQYNVVMMIHERLGESLELVSFVCTGKISNVPKHACASQKLCIKQEDVQEQSQGITLG